MSIEDKIEILEPNILTDKESKELAERISKLPNSEQKLELDKLLDSSTINGFKVAIALIKITKKSVDTSQKNNTTFINICDTAVKALSEYLKDGEISFEEKSEARKMINQIIECANDARKDSNNTTMFVIGGAIGVGCLTALAYIFSKTGKK